MAHPSQKVSPGSSSPRRSLGEVLGLFQRDDETVHFICACTNKDGEPCKGRISNQQLAKKQRFLSFLQSKAPALLSSTTDLRRLARYSCCAMHLSESAKNRIIQIWHRRLQAAFPEYPGDGIAPAASVAKPRPPIPINQSRRDGATIPSISHHPELASNTDSTSAGPAGTRVEHHDDNEGLTSAVANLGSSFLHLMRLTLSLDVRYTMNLVVACLRLGLATLGTISIILGSTQVAKNNPYFEFIVTQSYASMDLLDMILAAISKVLPPLFGIKVLCIVVVGLADLGMIGEVPLWVMISLFIVNLATLLWAALASVIRSRGIWCVSRSDMECSFVYEA